MYAKKLGESLSPTTVNLLHTTLHKILDDAMRWRMVARNACDAVTPSRRGHDEIKPLTLEQAQLLLEAAKEDSLEALWVLALTTGMRHRNTLKDSLSTFLLS